MNHDGDQLAQSIGLHSFGLVDAVECHEGRS